MLYFSDIPNNRVMYWAEKGGTVHKGVLIKPSGYTGTRDFGGKEPGCNGLALSANNTLHLCQHGDRRIATYHKDTKAETVFVTVVDRYEGKRLNSPNDLVFDAKDQLYFTDPPYGLAGGMKDPEKELDFQGVYFLPRKGSLVLLTKEMSRPNGIALSPDGKTLYVANSDPEKAVWMSFPVKADGTIGEGKVFFDATRLVGKDNPGLPDGMKVDTAGNVWATGPGGVLVFDPEGTHLGTIRTNAPTANCGWGDDGSTLYITANDRLIRVKTKAKGW
jgi:gluconolactonase